MTELLRARDVARMLKVNKATFYGLIEKDNIPAFKVGREWRFRMEALEEWMKRREQEERKKTEER